MFRIGWYGRLEQFFSGFAQFQKRLCFHARGARRCFFQSERLERKNARHSERSASMTSSNQKLNAFPVFLRVAGRAIVIVGGGDAALAKARLVAQSSAIVRIVADDPDNALVVWAARAGADLIAAPYGAACLEGAALVFAASGDAELDRRVAADARAAGIPVNAVDRPELCDFYTPAIVNRAPVAVAIGTEGAGPVLAQMLRARIDQMLPPSLGLLAKLAISYRDIAERLMPKGGVRRRFWKAFFDGAPARAIAAGDEEGAAVAASALLAARGDSPGHVVLVGAGPGAEDLLTLRAQRHLMEADVIVHDALVPEEVVAMGRRDAERIAAGKRKGCHTKTQDEINALLVSLAREGKRVVRLKCGDPLIFGRAGEEMQALRDAGISYEVVPGVTAAFAAASDFDLPLTLRGVASSVVFTTGHDLRGNALPDWAKLAIGGATVAVYMGRSNAAAVATHLIEAGLSPDTGVAVVENASHRKRRLFHGTLADLPSLEERKDLSGPVMTIIGDAVAGADFTRSEPLAYVRLPATGNRENVQ
jgi:uroporphyrin-III C-methyltransferase/precorrin-2 dehydrogenase/sirohydrochlorin ferrochelatase